MGLAELNGLGDFCWQFKTKVFIYFYDDAYRCVSRHIGDFLGYDSVYTYIIKDNGKKVSYPNSRVARLEEV